jgi:ribosome-binding protein aMBF1 (putative translation factor)
MKRIIRNNPLTPVEAADYRELRRKIDAELPELIARHHERRSNPDVAKDIVVLLKAERDSKGITLAELTDRTGLDPTTIGELENGQLLHPTVDALVRYADAVGKKLVLSLSDD